MRSNRAWIRGENGGKRDGTATFATRFGRVTPFLVVTVAAVFVGCSSQNTPTGSGGSSAAGVGGATGVGGVTGAAGMTGTGGAGTGGHAITDGGSGADVPATDDAGDASPQCTPSKACHVNGDCCINEWCFISAVISDCASAPTGVCTSHRGGNCGTHPNTCDCFNGLVSCSSSPGMECHVLSNNFNADGCFGCIHACGGSGQDCCTYGGSSPCSAGLTCSGGSIQPAGGTCGP